MQLTIKDVTIIARTAKSTRTRTKREAYALLLLIDKRLKAAAKGELQVEQGVRLTTEKIVDLLWKARKTVREQWFAARAPKPQQEQLELQREAGVA